MWWAWEWEGGKKVGSRGEGEDVVWGVEQVSATVVVVAVVVVGDGPGEEEEDADDEAYEYAQPEFQDGEAA